MGIILPFLYLLALFVLIKNQFSLVKSYRLAWVLACLAVSVLVIISTEILSLVHRLTNGSLTLFWAVIFALALIWIIRKKLYKTPIHLEISNHRFIDFVLLLLPAALLTATFVIALVAPPNNTDSMVYHMSRVAHWAQQKSIDFFATSTLRELFLNPFAEYAILHTYLLSGSDRFVNMIQWFSYLNAAILVSLFAKQLGASKKGQYLALMFALSIPQAILQSVSTQNDLTLSLFVLCAVYFIFLTIQTHERFWIFPATVSSVLAVLTKSTSFVFLLSFLVIFGVYLLLKWDWKKIGTTALSVVFALLLIVPFYLRNYSQFGSMLGPKSETGLYTNEIFSIKVLASNTIRNTAVNLTYTPWTSEKIQAGVHQVHQWLNLSESDARTTWQEYEFSVNPLTINEDVSGAPVHIWLILLAFIMLLIWHKRFAAPAHLLALANISSFLIFSGLLKWQPWNGRLELALVLLAAPLFGVVFDQKKWLTAIFGCGFFLISIPCFLFNNTKPLTQDWNIFNLPRVEMMLRRKDILTPYVDASIFIKKNEGCSKIGLELENGFWEYPIWNLLFDPNHPDYALQHINVNNESSSIEQTDEIPCEILLVNQESKDEIVNYRGNAYIMIFEEFPVAIYILK